MRVVKKTLDVTGKRKVEIFRRDDGSFGFSVLIFSDYPGEDCWIPSSRYSQCFTPNADRAEFEARGRVSWLAQSGPSHP